MSHPFWPRAVAGFLAQPRSNPPLALRLRRSHPRGCWHRGVDNGRQAKTAAPTKDHANGYPRMPVNGITLEYLKFLLL
jgi:hypothetical protein